VAIIRTILVEGPSEELRAVRVPEGQFLIDIDVNPETVLEGIRNHFCNRWKAKVHALRWLFPDDLCPPAEEEDPLLVLWVEELGTLPVLDPFDRQRMSVLFENANDLSHSLSRFLDLAVRSRGGAPWQRPDWLGTITEWVHTHFPEPQQLSQIRTSPNGAVVRIRNGDETYFLKSQPDSLAYESALLGVLNRHVPGACPCILPIAPDAHTHITEGIAGLALNEIGDAQHWQAALGNVAKLQIECFHFLEELITAGVPRYRIGEVATGVEGFFDDCVTLQAGFPNQLGCEEIRQLFDTMPEVARDFDVLGRCALPETLIHDDLNRSNVFHTPKGETTVIDWALSRISHPFFTLASAIFVPYNNLSSRPRIFEDLCKAYLGPWSDFERDDRLRACVDAASRLFWIDATIAMRLLCQDKYVDYRSHLPRFLRATLRAYRWRA
jgi:hypothetical protein